jgi:hypothetical protein
MTCQRCISLRSAVSFAHMPNSVMNAIRLQGAEEVHAQKGRMSSTSIGPMSHGPTALSSRGL